MLLTTGGNIKVKLWLEIECKRQLEKEKILGRIPEKSAHHNRGKRKREWEIQQGVKLVSRERIMNNLRRQYMDTTTDVGYSTAIIGRKINWEIR